MLLLLQFVWAWSQDLGREAYIPQCSGAASKQFSEEVLRAHNDYRKKHGVPSLKLCKKLNREAQQYSEALASTRILKHSPESSSGKCGENLAWASYDQSGSEVADRWYSEIKNYNFQSPGFSSGTVTSTPAPSA
ncbi:Golgi-associated plant pathogenesis-related protein 1 isoform X4 [Ahaetulla prasina]|uniref:Golgi-associated plant pathogenesis-related protein 1 isoform X4 n=1 Tax=Ahaetulla prasina TaxID=499056 RepID=UPI002647441F|nr:Golgi-associated plant pathogenesis-related protein 1 isoform X4 [Ahaetulla prasina]